MSVSVALTLAKKYANGGRVQPMTFHGIPISIENKKGTIREGTNSNGKSWANKMAADYGYIKRTLGKDGDQVDVFVGPNKNSNKVFVIDQLHHSKVKFDEHKCLVGFNSKEQALTAYHKSYGRKYGAHHSVGGVTEMSLDAFKEWLKGGGGKKPVSPNVRKYQRGGGVKYTEPTPEDPARYPYYESDPGPGTAPAQPIPPPEVQPPAQDIAAMPGTLPAPDIQAQPSGVNPFTAIAQHLAEYGATPGELMKGPEQIQPRVEGQWDELDEFRQRLAQSEWHKKATDFAAETGLNLFGTSAPFVQHGTVGVAGGKPSQIPRVLGELTGGTKFDLPPQYVAQDMKQISGSKGTSEGGVFVNPAGEESYIKINPSFDYSKNEVLTSRLYELAGVPAAKSQFTMLHGKPAVASKIIEGKQLSEFHPDQYHKFKNLGEHFPADAWLANWDAVGAGFENPRGNIIIDKSGNAHRIDFGGGLRYSGMGKEKGGKFTQTVDELTKMRDPGKNPSAASVFADVPLDPKNPTANRIANINDQQIWDLVNQYGPSSAAEKAKLGATLIARRDDLAKQFGIKKGKPSGEPPTGDPTDIEQWGEPKNFPKTGLVGEPVTPKHKYTLKNPKEDADRLLDNHVSHEHGEEAFDSKAIADDMYKMAEENPEHVDNVYKHLPKDVQEEANIHLSYKIEKEGDPWSKISLGPEKPAKGAPLGTGAGGTLKLMQLNKAHSTDQLVNSIKAYHKSELTVGKTITEKQKGKVSDMIGSAPAKQIADSIKNLDPQAQNNVLSWLPAAKAANVKSLNQVGEFKAAQPIPDIDKIKKSHSLYQVINAIKNYLPTQSEVPYHAYQSIPKELSKFSPSEIVNEMEPLSLSQKEKVMKWLPESTIEKMEKIEEAKTAQAKKMFVGQEYFDALENLNWQKWRPSEAKSIRHVFKPHLLKRIQEIGFNPDVTLFKGGKYEGYPTTFSGEPKPLLDPATEPHRLANPDEPAFFLSHKKEVAEAYGQVGTPYIARAPKAAIVDWKMLTGSEDYSSYHMRRLIKAAREKGLDLIVVRDISDAGGYGYNLQTQYAFLNTHVLRGPMAKFDPDKLHLRYPLAGLVGGGLFAYGTLRGQESEQYARGGSVKSTKSEANYRLGTKKEKCAICTMFRTPDSCTAVQGAIRPQDTCDYFELSKRKNFMPLKKGSSQKTISSNIREFHTGDTYAKTKAKFGKAKADRQAIAVAMSTARKYSKKKANGGGVDMEKMVTLGASRGLQRQGMIKSSVPGRTDKLPMNVKAGSYVLPADIPSALGQGNTMAGDDILNNMFSGGPYGMKPMRSKRRGGYPRMRMSKPRIRPFKQEGGEIEEPEMPQENESESHVPIIAAGGEYIISPDVVKDIGNGNLDAGHSVLDKFVLQVRKNHIDTLKKLPKPKK